MKCIKNLLTAILFVSFPVLLTANNIEVNNVALKNHNTTPGSEYIEISFDISWENSWRNSTNHDAAWVFAKYQYGDEPWGHVIIHDSDYSAPAGSEIIMPDDQVGFFIQRDSDGTGTINWEDVVIRWRYKDDNDLDDLDEIIVNVYAIEMVYVPEGAFYVGDGNTEVSFSTFYTIGTTDPYYIESEDEITLGGTTGGNLGNTGDDNGDDFNTDDPANEQLLPASYPKGFNAFYCMKYNITQKQYVDFLNTLTRQQQRERVRANISPTATSFANRYVFWGDVDGTPQSRNGIRVDAEFEANEPLVFYNDLNDDGTPNQDDDGQHLPSNFLSFADGAAYADWAGLRPMTELEYEKAARGTGYPIVNELPWGVDTDDDLNIVVIEGVNNSGSSNELPTNSDANCHLAGNDVNISGPVRVGIFATSDSDRIKAGASYYGVMDMGGNLSEQIISVGSIEGRSFDGQHGTGELTSEGSNNIPNWPGNNSSSLAGAGQKPCMYPNPLIGSIISFRMFINDEVAHYGRGYGFRGVRTEP